MLWDTTSLLSRPRRDVKKRTPHRNPLRLEQLEDRLTPAGFFLTGVGGLTNPATPFVRVYDGSDPSATSSILTPPGDLAAFNPDLFLPGRGPTPFINSVRVASGDVNGDGIDDIIAVQGPGGTSASLVHIFDGRQSLFNGLNIEIASFYAYSNEAGASQTPGLAGGVFVASADFNGDGYDELVVSAGAGGRGHIKVFDFNGGGSGFLGNTPALRSSFFAYTDFAGEIRVTTLQSGSTAFLITGSGAGSSQSDVRAYQNVFNIGEIADLTFVAPFAQLFPFTGYTGGVSVAAGDTDGDGVDELFVSKNSGVSTVLVIDAGTLATRASFTAFGGFNGEVRLGAADVDGRVEVLTSTGTTPGAGGAHVKAWSITGATADTIRSFYAYEGYINGVFLSTNDFRTRQTFASSDTPVAIPDNGLLLVRSTIAVDPRTSNDAALKPKSIAVDLVFTLTSGSGDNADLNVTLRAPNGTQLNLFDDIDPVGAGFNIRLTDTAAQNIENATAGSPTTGTFRPEGGASLIGTFGNFPIAGDWKLLVQDDAAMDTYTLTSWSLIFRY